MLNRNFANIMLASIIGATYPVLTGTDNVERTTLTTTQNATNYMKSIANEKSSALSNFKSTFMIGSGETDETIESIALATPIDETDFSISGSQFVSNNISFSNVKTVFSQIWTYTGNTEITIYEIGFVAKYGGILVLLDRTKLESPITVDSEHNTFTIALTIGGKAVVTLNP